MGRVASLSKRILAMLLGAAIALWLNPTAGYAMTFAETPTATVEVASSISPGAAAFPVGSTLSHFPLRYTASLPAQTSYHVPGLPSLTAPESLANYWWLILAIVLGILAVLLVFFLAARRRWSLVFITPAQTIVAGQRSPTMTIQIRNALGKPVKVKDDTPVRLSSTSPEGRFAPDTTSDFNGPQALLVIRKDCDSASFCYTDSRAGSPIIVAEGDGLESARQRHNITPSR